MRRKRKRRRGAASRRRHSSVLPPHVAPPFPLLPSQPSLLLLPRSLLLLHDLPFPAANFSSLCDVV